MILSLLLLFPLQELQKLLQKRVDIYQPGGEQGPGGKYYNAHWSPKNLAIFANNLNNVNIIIDKIKAAQSSAVASSQNRQSFFQPMPETGLTNLGQKLETEYKVDQ